MAYSEVKLEDGKDECRGRNGWFMAKKVLVGLTGAWSPESRRCKETHVYLDVESRRAAKNYPIHLTLEKAEAVAVAKAILHQAGLTEYRLLVVDHDIEPALQGPFPTEEARDTEAKRHRQEDDPAANDGLFMMDIVGGEPRVDSYSGRFFEEGQDGQA